MNKKAEPRPGFLRSMAPGEIFMAVLMVFVPLALALHFAHRPVPTFFAACLGIIPLAWLMGKATEMLAHRVGSGLGGFLNATFGNAAELIIGVVALRAGNITLVKASITGSIIGNILFVLGLAVFLGGLRRKGQTVNITAASAASSMLLLSVFALALPALFHIFIPPDRLPPVEKDLSLAIAVVLLVLYAASLLFNLKTHKHLYSETEGGHAEGPLWSVKFSMGVLVAATVGVGVMAEVLLHGLDEAIASMGLTETFVGVVIIALIGNAAEHSTAVWMAMKDRMNLSFTIAMESSKQIALFAAPLLVLLGRLFGPNAQGDLMDLDFAPMEVVAVSASVFMAAQICQDGETNWLEGALLLGVYAILAAGFFFIP
jgi:Ca2+:H+ antiporter